MAGSRDGARKHLFFPYYTYSRPRKTVIALHYLLHISTAFNVVAISDSSTRYISTFSDASVSKTDRQPFCCSRRPATSQSRCDVSSTANLSIEFRDAHNGNAVFPAPKSTRQNGRASSVGQVRIFITISATDLFGRSIEYRRGSSDCWSTAQRGEVL